MPRPILYTTTATVVVLLIARHILQTRAKKERVELFLSPHATPQVRAVASALKLDYCPPWWARHSWAQLLLLAIKQQLARYRVSASRTQFITLADGGEISLVYFSPVKEEMDKFGRPRPVILYLCGITGSVDESKAMMKKVTDRGMHGIAMLRRGHVGKSLATANFNLFGNTSDLLVAIEHIKETLPQRRVALVGSSAGSGVMVRFLGELGVNAPVVAAVGLSPGYNIDELWDRTQGSWLDRYLTQRLKQHFLHPNEDVLSLHYSLEHVEQLRKATSVKEFTQAAVPFAGCATYAEWLEKTCPYRVATGVAIPTLCLNARDDPICQEEFVKARGIPLANTSSTGVLVLTETGSHTAHVSADYDFWGLELALEFIDGICCVYVGTAVAFSALVSAVNTLRFIRKKFLRSNRPKRILLIRHGESQGNMDMSAYQRVPDPQVPLTKRGMLQARDLGETLKEMLNGSKCLVYVSPYLRAKQTAQIALRALNREQILCWVEDPRLREQEFAGSFQNPECMPHEERLRYSKFFFRWPGGESAADVYDRVSLFLDSLHRDFTKHISRDDVVVIFSHGLTSRLFIMRWLHYEVSTFEKTRNPPNASILEMIRGKRPSPGHGECYSLTDASLRILFSEDLWNGGTMRADELRTQTRRTRGVSCWGGQEQELDWMQELNVLGNGHDDGDGGDVPMNANAVQAC